MSDSPLHWTEYLKALGPTLIALTVAYIAFRQWRLAQLNLIEKLFDRRMEVYSSVLESINSILRSGKAEPNSHVALADAWQKSKFLYDRNVCEYIDTIRCAVIDLQMYESLIGSDAHSADRTKNIDKKYEKLKWLSNQHETLFKKFAPFLTIKEHG